MALVGVELETLVSEPVVFLIFFIVIIEVYAS